ncbi:hypothetical protein PF005_g4541 [Phytophthora fragariae]|uniref:FYVE zinc finger domain-containing protein n=1 Tax=Phytophthora fragariae TaxID=53985 RepID=A0A6A3SAI5_9STRA|nr:hypothetical protein PF009_g15220 [Phytophthora fragariae]KAE8986999.1 hypothetical protein PF011_g19749 [Phytophthora fragariae]KAE9111929.1 hypothetical protein PF007_g11300 [Phytophthora fragariae]KAE9128124.1 hypothetical protein PF010_g4631 [Phytophthora fragariae]KAE9150822.1 hypothetical protein PF006_g4828 [Phytophthora fragariae]
MKTQWALKVSAKSCKDCDKPFQVHSSRVNCHACGHVLNGAELRANQALDKLHAATKLDADVQGVAQELDASLDDQEQRADQKVNALYVGELCR